MIVVLTEPQPYVDRSVVAGLAQAVVSEGVSIVLGDRYVQLQLGGDPQVVKAGEDLGFTESAVILERLIGKFIHNVGVDKGDKTGDKSGGEGG